MCSCFCGWIWIQINYSWSNWVKLTLILVLISIFVGEVILLFGLNPWTLHFVSWISSFFPHFSRIFMASPRVSHGFPTDSDSPHSVLARSLRRSAAAPRCCPSPAKRFSPGPWRRCIRTTRRETWVTIKTTIQTAIILNDKNWYIYIYMYIWLYVYMIICIYDYMYIWLYVYMIICIYDYMYIWLYVYMIICIYDYMYIWLYVYIYICIYDYMYIWLYVYIYMYIYICIYICIYMYIYIDCNNDDRNWEELFLTLI